MASIVVWVLVWPPIYEGLLKQTLTDPFPSVYIGSSKPAFRQLSAILRMPEPQFSRYVILYSAVGDVIEIVEVPDQTPKSADNVLNALLDALKYIEKSEITF